MYSMYLLKSVGKVTQIMFFLLDYSLKHPFVACLGISGQCDLVKEILVQGFHGQAMIERELF